MSGIDWIHAALSAGGALVSGGGAFVGAMKQARAEIAGLRKHVRKLEEEIAELRSIQRGSIPDMSGVHERADELENEFKEFVEKEQEQWRSMQRELGWIRGTLEARGSRR